MNQKASSALSARLILESPGGGKAWLTQTSQSKQDHVPGETVHYMVLGQTLVTQQRGSPKLGRPWNPQAPRRQPDILRVSAQVLVGSKIFYCYYFEGSSLPNKGPSGHTTAFL